MVIVIGGLGRDFLPTATVELFQVKSRRWYKLTDLPQPLPCPSATICGDQLHVIGSDRNGYSCSLQSLPSNDRPITSPLTLSWKPLPPLPVEDSTAATLCGQLVLIGGSQGWSPANSIHQLVEGQWVELGSMTSGRHWCLAVSLSPDSGWIWSKILCRRMCCCLVFVSLTLLFCHCVNYFLNCQKLCAILLSVVNPRRACARVTVVNPRRACARGLR